MFTEKYLFVCTKVAIWACIQSLRAFSSLHTPSVHTSLGNHLLSKCGVIRHCWCLERVLNDSKITSQTDALHESSAPEHSTGAFQPPFLQLCVCVCVSGSENKWMWASRKAADQPASGMLNLAAHYWPAFTDQSLVFSNELKCFILTIAVAYETSHSLEPGVRNQSAIRTNCFEVNYWFILGQWLWHFQHQSNRVLSGGVFPMCFFFFFFMSTRQINGLPWFFLVIVSYVCLDHRRGICLVRTYSRVGLYRNIRVSGNGFYNQAEH